MVDKDFDKQPNLQNRLELKDMYESNAIDKVVIENSLKKLIKEAKYRDRLKEMKSSLASRSIALKQAEKYIADDFLLNQFKFGDRGFWDTIGDFIFIPKRAFYEGKNSSGINEISTKDGVSVRFTVISGLKLPLNGLYNSGMRAAH